MPDFPLCLKLQSRFIGSVSFIIFVFLRIKSMHKIIVEIVNPARLKLRLKQRTDFLFGFEIVRGKLVGKNITFARISACKASLYCRLALFAYVTMSGIKIIKTFFHKAVHHAAGLLNVHFFLNHRQTHAAKSKFFQKITLVFLKLLYDYNAEHMLLQAMAALPLQNRPCFVLL